MIQNFLLHKQKRNTHFSYVQVSKKKKKKEKTYFLSFRKVNTSRISVLKINKTGRLLWKDFRTTLLCDQGTYIY